MTDAATFGDGGYGKKASDVLIHTRGIDFRREKTKKKRGTYIGGTIGNEIRAIRFED